MTDWKKIRKEYETSKVTMKDLAEKHNVKYSTLRSRKNREDWQRNASENVATDDATKKDGRGAPKGNQNAKGNAGGGAPEGNKNAVSHGLFANWLPEDSLEIIRELSEKSPADMIWENILIQYTAIIRAQKIMFVKNQEDSSNELQGAKFEYTSGEDGNMIRIPVEESYNHQYAWDKHEQFMNAQSRAISTLSNLIKQYVAMADEDDSRKLELERMGAELKKAKAHAEIISAEADKLQATGKGFELLQSLVDVVNEDEN